MRNVSAVILNVMAVAWSSIAVLAVHAPLWVLAGPALASACVLALMRHVSGTDMRRSPAARRVIILSLVGEGLGVVVGLNLLLWAGRLDFWASVLALAVGGHFLPMARWIPAPRYYFAAFCLLLAAAIGALLNLEMRGVVIGVFGAVAMWGACLIERGGKMFFSEEKNQKTFVSPRRPG